MLVDILGVKVNNMSYSNTLNEIRSYFSLNNKEYIVTANPEIILHALNDVKYQEIVNKASLVTADGIGILWAAKFLKLKSNSYIKSIFQIIYTGVLLIINPKYFTNIFPERITGVDLMQKICKEANKNSWKIYLLGGEEGVAKKTASKLQRRYKDLKIVGFEQEPDNKTINRINESKVDILFVAFGAPKQEFWIDKNLNDLNIKLAMGVGGAFDFISGKAKRAPQIYLDLNIEWLFRLINEPWRFIRIFNATFRFIYIITKFKHQMK